jgi:predicted transcriptional regulator
MNMIAIEDTLLERFHRLATETHRAEADIIRDALASYLDADENYVRVLHKRLDSANRGEFASDQEVDRFFSSHGD